MKELSRVTFGETQVKPQWYDCDVMRWRMAVQHASLRLTKSYTSFTGALIGSVRRN